MARTFRRQSNRERMTENNKAHRDLGLLWNKEPQIQENVPAKRKYSERDPTKTYETDVVLSILDFLKYHPAVWWAMRIHSGTWKVGDRWVKFNYQKGMSDIIGMFKGGRMFVIEVKRPDDKKNAYDKATQDQIDYVEHISQGGGLGFFADRIEDVEAVFKLNGIGHRVADA